MDISNVAILEACIYRAGKKYTRTDIVGLKIHDTIQEKIEVYGEKRNNRRSLVY